MISNSCSLSYPSSLLQLSVSDCVKNREAHSLFILVSDLTITYQGQILYESLITLEPQNCGDFALQSTRRDNLNSIVGTIVPTYNGGLTSLTLHELIILMTLPIGTSGYNEIQMILPIGTSGYNISEYILKLQIHQHSLLTRKVFS